MVNSPAADSLPEGQQSATVLVAELFGFSAFADQADQPVVRQLLKETWRRIARVIADFHGRIVTYIGDELIVIWDAEVPGDDAELAVNCALALQRVPAGMAAEGRAGVLGRLKFKVGISTGDIFVMRTDPSEPARVIGETLNTAKRFAELADPDKILIGTAAFRRVQGVFRMQRVSDLYLRGKTDPVEAYFVDARHEHATRIRYTGTGGLETRMVGRDNEFQSLKSLLEALDVSADPFLVLLIGEMGLGKSRLLLEFSGEVESAMKYYNFMAVRNHAENQRAPFFMWKSLLRNRFGIRDDMSEAVAQDTLLKGILRVWGKRLGKYTAIEAAHLIGDLIGISWRNSPYLLPFEGDPAARNARAFDLVRELFNRMADSGQVVLVVDDLQWIDLGSMELLLHVLAQSADALPMLILASAPPDFVVQYPEWGRLAYRVVDLEPIPYSFEMIVEAFPSLLNLPDPLLARMINKVSGNPLYLEEIARHIHFSRLKGKDVQRKISVAYPIPDTLNGLLAMRLEQVSQQASEVLQLASVTGRSFWRGSVLAAAKQPVGTGLLNLPAERLESAVDEALREIVRAELAFRRSDLVFGEEQEYIFKHSQFQEVAYENLPVKYRKFYHFAAAKWLAEKAGPDRQVIIARHFEIAGNISSALRYYQYAWNYAKACGIPAEVEALERHIRTIRRSEQTIGPEDSAG